MIETYIYFHPPVIHLHVLFRRSYWTISQKEQQSSLKTGSFFQNYGNYAAATTPSTEYLEDILLFYYCTKETVSDLVLKSLLYSRQDESPELKRLCAQEGRLRLVLATLYESGMIYPRFTLIQSFQSKMVYLDENSNLGWNQDVSKFLTTWRIHLLRLFILIPLVKLNLS